MPTDHRATFAGERVRYDQDGAHLTVDRPAGAPPPRFLPAPLSAYSRLILGAHGFISGMTSPNALTFYGRYSDPKRLPELAFPAIRLALEIGAKDGDELAEWARIEGTSLHGPWAEEMARELARILAPALDRTREAAELVNAAAEHVRAWLAEKVDGAEESFSAHLLAAEIANWDRIPAVYGAATAADEDGLPLALADVLANDVWTETDRKGIRQARLSPSTVSDSPPFTTEGRVWAWLGAPDHLGAGSNGLLRVLAWRLWKTRWRETAERIQHKPAALVGPVHAAIGTAFRGLPLSKAPPDPRQLEIPGLRPIPNVGAQAFRDAMEGAVKVSPALAHRTIRALVRWGAIAHAIGETGFPVDVWENEKGSVTATRTASGVDIVVSSGGFDLLTDAVGHNSKAHSPRAILDVFGSHGAAWDGPEGAGGRGPLLSWHSDNGSKIAIHLGPLLAPGIAGAKGSRLQRHEKVLIPTLPVPSLDGIGGRAHKGLCNLDWAAIDAFVDGRGELIEHGGVILNWDALARSAGIAKRSRALPKALDLWVAKGEDALDPERTKPTARWVEVSPGRFTFVGHGPEGAALRFVLEGAEQVRRGSERGRRSARRRKRR